MRLTRREAFRVCKRLEHSGHVACVADVGDAVRSGWLSRGAACTGTTLPTLRPLHEVGRGSEGGHGVELRRKRCRPRGSVTCCTFVVKHGVHPVSSIAVVVCHFVVLPSRSTRRQRLRGRRMTL